MSILNILGQVNWLAVAEKGVTVSESLLPLLVKTALDAAKVGSDPAALMALLSDLEADMSAIEAAFKSNNTEIVPPSGAPS